MKKKFFWGRYDLLPRMSRLEWAYCTSNRNTFVDIKDLFLIFFLIFLTFSAYSRLTLVVTFWEASHISLKKTFSSFLSLYIVSYTPRGFPICEKKFHRFSFKNLWTSKWKIYFLPQKVVTHFFDFIGFMVVKTTGSTSGLTSFLRFWKQCTIAGEIGKTNKKIN